MLLYEFFDELKINEDAQSDRINFIVDQIKTNPEVMSRVYRLVQSEMDVVANKSPKDMLAPALTKPETDHLIKGLLNDLIQALNNTPGDYDDITAFLSNYGKVSYINTQELMKPGFSGWGAWLQGNGKVSEGFITALYKNLFPVAPSVSGSPRGPGEIGLALLSPNITLASVGDLVIDGIEVEVKGEKSKGGGRLKNANTDFGTPNLKQFYDKVPDLDPKFIAQPPTGNAGKSARYHYQDIAKLLDQSEVGLGQQYVEELFRKTYINADADLINRVVQNYDRVDRASITSMAMEVAYSSYANILKKKNFSMFLLLKLDGEKSVAFDVADWKNYLEYFKLGGMDFDDRINGPAVQISML
tara:strand:- start:5 stop:1078 length:1074 start_codon:yes stop_codon:yes gene_type:complete